MLRRVALVRTDVSEELSASFIRVTRIGELATTLAINSNRRENLKFLIAFSGLSDKFEISKKKKRAGEEKD
jgi:hypothetical protein